MPYQNLYTVDNSSEEQSVKNYLRDWCSVSKQMDIATGYLEIGGLLELDSHWQKLDKIRIILGNEVTKRTQSRGQADGASGCRRCAPRCPAETEVQDQTKKENRRCNLRIPSRLRRRMGRDFI